MFKYNFEPHRKLKNETFRSGFNFQIFKLTNFKIKIYAYKTKYKPFQ